MIENLEQLDPDLKALFKNRVASEIYLQLKRQPMQFSELETAIECSPASLSNQLKSGKIACVWVEDNKYYKLTNKGENLPDCVGIHAAAQRDGSIEYQNRSLDHLNQEGNRSTVKYSDGEKPRTVTINISSSVEDYNRLDKLNWYQH